MKENRRGTQCACYSLEDKEGRLLIKVELPTAKRKRIPLHVTEDRFHVSPRFVRG